MAKFVEARHHFLLKPFVHLPFRPKIAHAVLYPLEVGNGNAAGIGQNVGNDEDTFVVQDLIGLRCGRAISSFCKDLALDPVGA